MTNLWSGRFETAPDAAAFQFGASFRFDRRLFEDDVTGSIAWVHALASTGVLPHDDAKRIEEALTAMLERGRSDPAFVDGPDEDVHSFVERLLVERLGDAGRRLHTGRSRNEQVSLDLRLYLRRRIPLVQHAVARVLYALAMTMVHLSRLAEDIIILSGDEHRFFELSDALSTGSSMMPQKKNPDPLELVRGKSGRAIGHLVGLLTTIKGLPTGYNKDLQEDKEAVFGAEDTLSGCLAVVRSVVGGVTLNRARAASAASGLLLATDVADYLVGRGVPFRRAHEIVGALVRRLVAEGRDFESLSIEEWRTASDRFEPDVVSRVTPAVSVGAKRTPQSTGPSAVRARLAEGRQWLDDVGELC